MTHQSCLHLRFHVLLFWVLISVLPAGAAGLTDIIPAAENKPEVSIAKEPESPRTTIPNLISHTTDLSKRLLELEGKFTAIDPAEKIRDKTAVIEKELETLKWESKMQEADTNLSYDKLAKTLQDLNQLQIQLDFVDKPLKTTAEFLDDQKKIWSREQQSLKEWTATLKKDKAFPLVREDVARVEKSMENILATIEQRTRTTLELLKITSDLQIRLYSLKIALNTQLEELKRGGFEQTSPPLYSRHFYSRLHLELLRTTWHNALAKLNDAYRITVDNIGTLLLVFCLPILFAFFLIVNRQRLKKHKSWSLLIDCPVSFSVFTVLIFALPLMESTMGKVMPMVSIGLILSVMRLAGKLERNSIWVVRFIYALGIFLALSLLKDIIAVPLPLERLFITGSCSAWLVYFTWRIFSVPGKEKKYLRMALRFVCVILIVIIATSLFGYDRLSKFLFKATFVTIFLFISSVILYRTTSILLELLLSALPVIRRHTAVIISSLRPFIFVLCAILFYASVSSIWLLFPTAQDAVTALANFGFTVGGVSLTMKNLLIGVGIIYGAFLTSRALQAILLDEIMPRNNIDRGVQLSIARLVHYTVITIGLIILLQVMGVSLTKLTILGGALSVGIGFGLQAIVNNFASGLILLFERPIKVGDTIELGTDMGEVKHLGLRSTIIKTFDNAEIVVPNSDLITAQVTNWTLAERRARVKLPVGVAYGSDIPTVLEILLRVAGEHPMILTTPPPRALFLAFGASSLDFELRVWIADFNNRRQVQSELNQEINSEFADAGIEIPFPQADLHIRTVDEEAAAALHPGKTHCSDKTTPAEDTI
jgi:small-conductance mechanosensitive channel